MLELNESNFAEHTQSGLVLVDFFTPWCGPCRLIPPVLEQLENIEIFKVNVSENQDLSVQFRVSHVPCLVYLKDGVEVARFVGLESVQTLQAKVNELL